MFAIGALLVLCALAGLAAAQPGTHPHATLLTARATPQEVVPPPAQASPATATGAFVISADAKKVDYRLTWDRVSRPITRIDVHNFGRGGTGQVVATLCGDKAKPCPDSNGGTIQGTWQIDAARARELGVERMYVDVHTERARDGELRGQILPLPWMVHSEQYLGRLRNGTATVYVTHFPQGPRIQIDLTVANMVDKPALVQIGRSDTKQIAGAFRSDVPGARHSGGTISAGFAIDGKAPLGAGALEALSSGKATLSVVVGKKTVSSGALTPVR